MCGIVPNWSKGRRQKIEWNKEFAELEKPWEKLQSWSKLDLEIHKIFTFEVWSTKLKSQNYDYLPIGKGVPL